MATGYRSRLRASLVVASLALAACAGPLTQSPPPDSAAPVPLVIAKAEYGFEATYNVAGNAYLAAVKAGALTGQRKAAAKSLLVRAYSAVTLARAAQRIGDARGLAEQAAAVSALTIQTLTIINGRAS